MGRIFDRTRRLISDGQSDVPSGIPTKLEKLDKYIHGTRQATYYLYGAESGVGKTTFAREIHIHVPYEYYKLVNDTDQLDILNIDFSLEVSAEYNMGAAIVRRLFLDHGKVVPLEHLFGWDRVSNREVILDPEIVRLVDSYKDYFSDFERKLLVVDEETTPTFFHDFLMEVAKRYGRFNREGRWISECGSYTANNPNMYFNVIVDTVNLTDKEPGNQTVKDTIDRISRIAVWFRNKCGFTFVFLQQFNADISATDRRRYGIKTPLLRDFEDSKRTTKDANIVVGLFDPTRHMSEDEEFFRGYDISVLRSWFRSAHILKNRYGQSQKFIPMKFDGAVGVFTQLPDAQQMGQEEYLNATRHEIIQNRNT